MRGGVLREQELRVLLYSSTVGQLAVRKIDDSVALPEIPLRTSNNAHEPFELTLMSKWCGVQESSKFRCQQVAFTCSLVSHPATSAPCRATRFSSFSTACDAPQQQ